LDGRGGPVEHLAAGLRELREKAGRPGYRQMAARANYSVATLSAAASGRRLPTLDVTLAYVAACGGDRDDWERRWREAERRSVPDLSPADEDGRPPYPGLAMFQPEDADVFFGRAALVNDLVRRLDERRLLVVFGASGAGKSSVVRAGLVPALRGPAVVLTPGTSPIKELAAHLSRHAGVPAHELLSELREKPERAHLIVPSDAGLLVVVDQFEEVFATGVDPAERAAFVEALLTMWREPDSRTRVVLAVRADHYARFAEHPELLTGAQVLIGGMSPAELREAVTGPAEQRGARVEGALVATVVAEASDSPGALPLAAHALREAWQRRQGAMVTLAGYQAAGGVAGAVAHSAEQVYESLSEPEQAVARRLLLRMVDVGPDGLIIRRRLDRAEYGSIPLAPVVIEAFAAARLVSVDRDTAGMTHEALISAWPRLRGWVDESRAGLRLHRRLTEATAAWVGLERDESALYRGLRLSTATDAADAGVLEPTGVEREFLEAGRAAQRREASRNRRRTRGLFAGLVAVLTVVSVLAAVAAVSARRAVAQRDRAEALQLAASARAERLTDPELALLLASRAYRLHPDAETERVLRQATSDVRSVSMTKPFEAEIFSLDAGGSLVAGADDASVVKAWDLSGRTAPVTAPVSGSAVAVGPAGSVAIAVPAADGETTRMMLWRPEDPGRTQVLEPSMPGSTAGVAYSADGRWVAAIGDDSKVYVWDTTRERPLRSLSYTGTALDLDLGPGGQLALVLHEGAVRIWNLASSQPPRVLRQPADSYPGAVAISPDGRRIAVGGFKQVTVWRADGSAGPQTYRGPEAFYTSVAFSPDGRRIAAGTEERTVRVWDTDNTRGLALRGHHGAVRQVAFGPDGRTLVSGGADSTVRVWDTATGFDTIAVPGGGPTWPALSSDGSFTAAELRPGTISVFPSREPGKAVELSAPPGALTLAVSADGRDVAATSAEDERIHWWRVAAGGRPTVLECPNRPDNQLTSNTPVLSDDGRTLGVDCGEGKIFVWLAGAGPPHELDGFGPFAVSPDLTVATASRYLSGVSLAGLDGTRPARTLPGLTARADHVRFSPDGRRLAVAGDDGAVRVWTVGRAGDPVVLTGAAGQITAIAFSPDGRLIAGLGSDAVARLWNTGGGEPLTVDLPAGADELAFSADGRHLVTATEATVRFVPCEVCGPIDEVVELADRRATRDLTEEERARYLRESD
jgi:WD40 repeat protein